MERCMDTGRGMCPKGGGSSGGKCCGLSPKVRRGGRWVGTVAAGSTEVTGAIVRNCGDTSSGKRDEERRGVRKYG